MSFDSPFWDWLFVGVIGCLFIGAACAVGVIAAVLAQFIAWGLE